MRALFLFFVVVAHAAAVTGCDNVCTDSTNVDYACFVDENTCTGADASHTRDTWTRACVTGLDSVPAEERGAMVDCLACWNRVVGETCDYEQVFAECSCLGTSESTFEAFNAGWAAEVDAAGPICQIWP